MNTQITKTAIKEAHDLFNQMGGDPQTAYAVVEIARAVDNDPQKICALLKIARFLQNAQ